VNDWWLAQAAFQQATSSGPNSAQAWAWLGEAQQQTSTGDGRSALDRALSLGPQDTLVRALRGLYWKRHGQYGAELLEYKAAAGLEPGNPQWQTALGEAYSLAGDQVSALAAYQKATALAPDNATYWRLLAAFSAENSVRVLDVGVPAAQRAVELAPEDPQAQDALGWAFAQAGLLYKAQQALTEAATLAPDLALPHLHLAEVALRSGDQVAAQRELKLTQQLDPDGPFGALAGQLRAKYFP
jgi:tetratricopeptide (TPR) repeat protein